VQQTHTQPVKAELDRKGELSLDNESQRVASHQAVDRSFQSVRRRLVMNHEL